MSTPETPPPTLPQGTRLGHYEIVSILGKGGMGEVYRGRDTRLDRSVAIKVLPAELSADPERRQRFDREARTISGLSHPHICALHDVGREGDRDFLVLEFLEGETLAERIRTGPLPTEEALRHAIHIAEALDSAHRQGIVHRDLKPGNVMLTRSGAKLLDFGLAKIHASLPSQSQSLLVQMATGAAHAPLTAEGMVLGTFQYVAPEQLEGGQVDARSDIFSFGAVLYEMLSGQKAFSGRNPASVIGAILHTDPPSITSLQPLAPPELERIVRKCLAKDPEDRWQSARDLADALKWIAQGSSAARAAVPASRKRPAWRALAVNVLVAAAAAALGLLVAGRSARERPRTVRSAILPPDGHALAVGSGSMALSPDGRMVAFVAKPSAGPARLFVRPLHGLTAQALAGTDEATGPFWSPDSRHLAFAAGGKLRRIEVAGGSSQVLCDAGLMRGGSWSRDGVIVFAPDTGTAIHRVAATGGVPVPVTTLDPTAEGEMSHRWPSFLPDGRHFLYMGWRGPGAGGHPIYVGSVEGGPRKLLRRAASNAAFAAPHHLLFVGQGTLLAQRLDPARVELSGDPFPVGDGVLAAPSSGRAPFSASDNGVLAYQAGGSGESDQLVWLDRRGQLVEALSASGQHSSPRLSRDGKRAALTVYDARNDTVDLWIRDLERQVTTRFTTDPTDETFPVWSPDGNRIVYTSTRGGKAGDLYLKPPTGGAEEVLLASEERKIATDWSPDGRHVLYYTVSARTRSDLWALSLEERRAFPVLQTEFEESEGEFSPDGRWIAYRSTESGVTEVCVRRFEGSGGRWQVSSAGGKMPKWRADGKELFYSGRDWVLMAVDVKPGPEFQAGAPRPLFEARMRDARYRQYDASADGQRFLVSAFALGENPAPLTLVSNWTAELDE
jgi:eukaryotic-like serine/threonine-protein kinase